MTPQQEFLMRETTRLALGGGPFVALTLVAAYRDPGWSDPTLVRFAHATAIAGDRVAQGGTEGLLRMPEALRRVAGELDEKRGRFSVPPVPETPMQKVAAGELARIDAAGGPFAALALTAAYRDAVSDDPAGISFTHASALGDRDPRAARLALDRLPDTLREIAEHVERGMLLLRAKA